VQKYVRATVHLRNDGTSTVDAENRVGAIRPPLLLSDGLAEVRIDNNRVVLAPLTEQPFVARSFSHDKNGFQEMRVRVLTTDFTIDIPGLTKADLAKHSIKVKLIDDDSARAYGVVGSPLIKVTDSLKALTQPYDLTTQFHQLANRP
jgi:hypothetical protein